MEIKISFQNWVRMIRGHYSIFDSISPHIPLAIKISNFSSPMRQYCRDRVGHVHIRSPPGELDDLAVIAHEDLLIVQSQPRYLCLSGDLLLRLVKNQIEQFTGRDARACAYVVGLSGYSTHS